MMTRTAESRAQTVDLVEQRLHEGKSDAATSDLDLLIAQYSSKTEQDRTNQTAWYMDLGADKCERIFKVTTGDLENHQYGDDSNNRQKERSYKRFIGFVTLIFIELMGIGVIETVGANPEQSANYLSALFPFDPRNFLLRADVRLRTGNTQQSRADYERSLRIAPKDPSTNHLRKTSNNSLPTQRNID